MSSRKDFPVTATPETRAHWKKELLKQGLSTRTVSLLTEKRFDAFLRGLKSCNPTPRITGGLQKKSSR